MRTISHGDTLLGCFLSIGLLASSPLAGAQAPDPPPRSSSPSAKPGLAAKPVTAPAGRVVKAAIPAAPARRLAEPGHALDELYYCVIEDGGAFSCLWGGKRPARIENVQHATQVVAGAKFVCALVGSGPRKGTVWCLTDDQRFNVPEGQPVTMAVRVALPFPVRDMRGLDGGLVLRSADGRIHMCKWPRPDGTKSYASCDLKLLDVPDVDAYVETPASDWPTFVCTLDRNRAPSCKVVLEENNSRVTRPLALQGFPPHVRRLVEGMGTGAYEASPVVCAVGSGGELACFGHRGLRCPQDDRPCVAEARRIALPGPVRDLAIGCLSGRAALEDGRLFEVSLAGVLLPNLPIKRVYPAHDGMTLVPTRELVDLVGGGSCVRYRSGEVECNITAWQMER